MEALSGATSCPVFGQASFNSYGCPRLQQSPTIAGYTPNVIWDRH